MSYSEIKPDYYRMHQPDSPWHAGAPGWKSAPWPGWGQNPAQVGPPRLAVDGIGAYFAPQYERAIPAGTSGLGSAGCGCGGRGVGDDAAAPVVTSTGMSSNVKGALMIAGAGVVLLAMALIPGHWDDL